MRGFFLMNDLQHCMAAEEGTCIPSREFQKPCRLERLPHCVLGYYCMEVACRRLARFPAWECLFSRPIHRFSQCRLFSDPSAAAAVRVAKRIASSHGCSRRDAEKLILEGRVRVNGAVLSSPAVVVSPSDVVLVDGEFVKESPPPKVMTPVNKSSMLLSYPLSH